MSGERSPHFTIRLMGHFRLSRRATSLVVPTAASRLIAFMVLRNTPVDRSHVAGQLWPDLTEQRARANLRNAAWRVNAVAGGLIEGDTDVIGLTSDVETDVTSIRLTAERLLDGVGSPDTTMRADLFAEELLVGWDDDWALLERERLKQLCLHALEALSVHRLELGAHAAAIDAALLAIRLEPLRESAHRALSRAYLAEGNVAQARRQYDAYRRFLDAELGLPPSASYSAMLRDAGSDTISA